MGAFVSAIVEAANYIYNKVDKALDYLSYHLCPDRPTHKLATDSLHIPQEDLSWLESIFNAIGKTFGLIIIPLKMLSDKKFCVHIYETTTVFTSQNTPQIPTTVNTCEKMLMYLAKNRNKINDPNDKQIIKTFTLHNEDYDIPVNFWYSFNIDPNHQVYFYAHVSVIENYRGVVIAVDKRHLANLALIKNNALELYNQTIGKQVENNIEVNLDKKVDFI